MKKLLIKEFNKFCNQIKNFMYFIKFKKLNKL